MLARSGRMRVGAFMVAAMVCWAATAQADRSRVALVIGNSDYQNAARLDNPVRDAAAMADMLRLAGFDVDARENLGTVEIKRAIREFMVVVRGADIAVVYYAGHGIEVGGTNYLVPVDARLATDYDAQDEAVTLDRILTALEPARRLRLVMLDACRDNPFNRTMKRTLATRAVGQGLARVEPQTADTLVAFAAKAGSTASDGSGQHSPFTAALLQHLPVPGLDIRLALGRVRDDVLETTGHLQEPFVYGSLGGRAIAIVEAPATPPVAAPRAEPRPGNGETRAIEIAFWDTIKASRNPRLYEAYLRRYPDGAFAEIARIRVEELRVAAVRPPDRDDGRVPIADRGLLRELRDRLYELNFDPGAADGTLDDQSREAVREFETSIGRTPTGQPTMALLDRLREVGGLKPWGTIAYAERGGRWGMAWGQPTRGDAVAAARASCGPGSRCGVEISFFGTECAAFAHSGGAWAIVARDDVRHAREDALADCRRRGKACRIVAAVCADGAERFRIDEDDTDRNPQRGRTP